ncbi:MAG TPA: winged helix-turn-helix domain-containing protein, partial [Acidimicrobiales bacterium]|nr:winged helix-turn-helix domain-containing protein [Acidimicrobiales bacterium]
DGPSVGGTSGDGTSGDGLSGDGLSGDGPSVGGRARVELSDPRALRAMAHPTRLALVGLLRREGPLTATQAAAYVGESPSSCSFHLRQLEKWGLVEEAGGGRGRERPWKATAEVTSWRRASVQGDTGAARTALDRVLAQRYLDQIVAWFERRSDEPQEWQELSGLGDWVL